MYLSTQMKWRQIAYPLWIFGLAGVRYIARVLLKSNHLSKFASQINIPILTFLFTWCANYKYTKNHVPVMYKIIWSTLDINIIFVGQRKHQADTY